MGCGVSCRRVTAEQQEGGARKGGVPTRVGCPQGWPETVASSLDVMKELDSGNCNATLSTIPPHCHLLTEHPEKALNGSPYEPQIIESSPESQVMQ